MRRLGGIAALLLLPSLAAAGGFGRPNQIGARAVGMGGAFAAVADDPWAVWHNPAGLAFPDETQVSVDLSVLKLDRVWTPPMHATIEENTPPQVIPGIGASTRFAFGREKPARLALGVAFYVAYGGKIQFDPATLSDRTPQGLLETGLTLLEVTPAVAYQVADVLSVGAALRVGIGTFDVTDVENAFRADNVSATGAGIGGSFSVMVRPHPRVSIGAVYRTTLSTSMSGSGQLTIAGMAQKRDMTLDVRWPQSASLGLSVRVAPFLRLVAQGDWTAWSSIQQLVVQFSGIQPQIRAMRFMDSYTLHLGAEATVSRFAARAGFSLDGNAIPDETSRRETRDGLKYDVTLGAGARFWRVRVDLAADILFGGSTPRAIAAGPESEAGNYSATVLTFQATGTIAF